MYRIYNIINFWHCGLWVVVCGLCVGCGYAPVSGYANKIFESGVYVEITMDPKMPEASVGVKDSIHLAILTRFHNALTSKQNASSIIDVRVVSAESYPISYDDKGFISFYRVNVVLDFNVVNKNGKTFRTTNSGYYDYAANATSVLLIEEGKFNAITNAANQALDKFVSQMAYGGAREIYENKATKETITKEETK
ncbi:LPS assembly lipoprotein LptE [Helicobacter sp. 23-1046]